MDMEGWKLVALAWSSWQQFLQGGGRERLLRARAVRGSTLDFSPVLQSRKNASRGDGERGGDGGGGGGSGGGGAGREGGEGRNQRSQNRDTSIDASGTGGCCSSPSSSSPTRLREGAGRQEFLSWRQEVTCLCTWCSGLLGKAHA